METINQYLATYRLIIYNGEGASRRNKNARAFTSAFTINLSSNPSEAFIKPIEMRGEISDLIFKSLASNG